VSFGHSSLETRQQPLLPSLDGCADQLNGCESFHVRAKSCPKSIAKTFGKY
jgi:hypothetical protein